MILTDAGPLVALLDAGDQHHSSCMSVLRQQSSSAAPLLTSWPCFTEAMYLLGATGGHNAQAMLWSWRSTGDVALHSLTVDEVDRMEELMMHYRDTPMDLADASLVAVAEARSLRSIFTIDKDFFIYRLKNGSALEVLR